ncbi:uncharacterized protein TRIADDRAFT_53434 [Trichoplax adhaerens]|uniref:Calponin-homology (CH) domain-containing protein n=1 Tax=Trichoplax adhaerens TaxID=10228 RepID=B3RP79_TRIAD|nr:hypothetical protein TRIADDRAFT_53434 [Trichoplax adhaerens]EDV27588.1 hypothetical protein TRIADDRAFT_53434 [Trichoplax adhaerens]|eukprot:XP_002109422.1 hypothetical protein TRIADDRAFT_53434 [Trichoplax adhaerens]
MTDHCIRQEENKENVASSEPFLKFVPFNGSQSAAQTQTEDDHPVLVLKHFAQVPKLYFDKVKVGRNKSILLTIVNPSSKIHHIKVGKVSELKGFTVNTTTLAIQPESQQQLEITWNPKVVGSVHDTLVLVSQNTHRLHVVLNGTAIESPHKKRTGRRLNQQRHQVNNKLHKINTSKPNQKAVLNTVIDVLQGDANKNNKSESNQKVPTTTTTDAVQNDTKHQVQDEQTNVSTSNHHQQYGQEKFVNSQLVDFQSTNHDNQLKKSHFGNHIIRETYTKSELEDSLLGNVDSCPDDKEDNDNNNRNNSNLNTQESNSKTEFKVRINKTIPNKCVKAKVNSESTAKNKTKQQQLQSSQRKATLPKTFNIRGIAQSRLRLISNGSAVKKTKTISPFASQNNCYDDRWIDKQERGFTCWLNFILVPCEDGVSMNKFVTKVDASTLALTTDTTTRQYHPTKDTLSYKNYENRKHLMMLRRAACILYQSKPVRMVVERITDAVKERKFTFKLDANIHSDLGLKQNLLDLLLSYNPLWLRIGLETIYGEVLMIESNQDIIGLSTFIISRFLSNPDIIKKYRDSSNLESFSNKKDFKEALGQYVIKQFLLLIFCIDQAKLTRLIDHDPCLFCMDAKFKSSRDLLLKLSREYLRGEGDIIRHLGQFGYNVTHVQTPLDEYNYAVTNLAVDLRDGVRLARLIELFSREWGITSNLKLPVNSRLQKLKNVQESLAVLKEKKLLNNIEVKLYGSAIVDGHREKTLALLWKVIQHYQVNVILNEDHLREEIIYLRREYRKKLKLLSPDIDISYTIPYNDMYVDHLQLNLLLSWCQSVCKLYGIEINNFTASFGDGRALCCLVHHYHPGLLPYSKIRHETTLTILNYEEEPDDNMTNLVDTKEGWSAVFSPKTGKASKYDKLKANEKYNFNLYNHKIQEMRGVPLLFKASQIINGIPEEKVMIAHLSYLCSKLLEIRQESRAAICIQKAWRSYSDMKELIIQQNRETAAIKLQGVIRGYLTRKDCRNRINKVVIIQSYWRGYVARCLVEDLRQEQLEAKQEYAATVIESAFRGYIARKHYCKLREAIVKAQSIWRGGRVRCELTRQYQAAQIIQRYYRNSLITKAVHEEYCRIKNKIILLQAVFRGWHDRCFVAKFRAAICIQSHWRGYHTRRNFMRTKQEIVTVQSCVRRWFAQRRLQQYTTAAITIQSMYRRWHVQQNLQQQRKAATIIQKSFRCYYVKQKYRQLQQSALVIQQQYRAMRAMQIQQYTYLIIRGACITLQAAIKGYLVRKQYLLEKAAAIRIQSHYRCYKQRQDYIKLCDSTIILQRRWRATCLQRTAIDKYRVICQSILTIQTYYRGWVTRKCYNTKLRSALIIQSAYRRAVCQRLYLNKKFAAIMIQSNIRRWISHRAYVQKYHAIMVLQAFVKGWLKGQDVRRVCDFYAIRQSCIFIQSRIRGYLARKELIRKRNAVRCIENCYLTYTCRCRYLNTQHSAITIQRWWLSVKKGRACRQFYLTLTQSSILIQSMWQMHIARSHYIQMRAAAILIQSHYRRYRQIKKYTDLKIAASIIQQRYRAQIEMRKVRAAYSSNMQASIVLQSAWRSYVVRRQYLQTKRAATLIQSYHRRYLACKSYNTMKIAAVVIQQRYRAQIEMRKVHTAYSTIMQASIILQSAWRSYVVRRQYLQMKRAATLIQSYQRRYLACKRYNTMKIAAVVIQQRYRAQVKMRNDEKDYLTTKASAIKIQAAYRGYQQRKSLAKKHNAAIKIQALWKMNIQRKMYLRQYHACTILQSHVRATLLTIKTRKRYLQILQSTILLQSMSYQKQREAVIKIQRKWRATLLRNHLHRHFRQMIQASLTIQKWTRRYLAMKQYNILKAVIKIQTTYRGHICRRQFNRERSAALKIQSMIRMHKQRCTYMQRLNAIHVIQKCTKAYLLGQQIRQNFNYKKMKNACTMIQTALRRHLAYKQYQHLRATTIKMQAQFRGKTVKKRYDQLREATITLQRRLRANWIARYELLQYHFIRGAIITIQSKYRSYVVRKKYCQLKDSIIKVQANVRCYQERNRYLQLLNAAIMMQRRYRSKIIAQKLNHEYRKLRQSAILIQAVYRGHLYRRHLAQHNAAAITIQSFYRGYQVRRNHGDLVNTVTKLQAMFRRKKAQIYYKQLLRACSMIQQRYRAKLAMKNTVKDYLCKRVAIIRLQSAVRGMFSRREAQKIRSTIKLQAHVRGMLQRQNYMKLKQSAIFIQSKIRSLLVRKDYQRQLNAIIYIQRWYRARCLANATRYSYLYTCGAIITIQATYRGYSVRKLVNKQREAAIQIQSFYRCYFQRRQYTQLRKNAILLQACVRRQQLQERYQQMQKATIILQNYYRAYKVSRDQRESYLYIRTAVIRLQSCWRGYRTRKQIAFENAALTLQKRYRMKLIGQSIRNNYLQLREAVICIQAFYRGHQCRKWTTKLRACRIIVAHQRGYMIRKRIAQQNQAARLIQTRWRLHNRYTQANRRIERAATLIQATWRGYIVRLNQLKHNKALEEARQRIKQANEAVTEDKKLSNRTKSALRWLLKPNIYMSKLHEALRNLDNPTKFSQVCSENLANSDALEIIFKLIKSLNHSVPSYDLNNAALDVLINVANFPTCTQAVYEAENSISTIIHVIHGYINKNNAICYKASHLLKILLESGDSKMKVDMLTKDVTSSKKLIKIFEKVTINGNGKHLHIYNIGRKNSKIASSKHLTTSCLLLVKELLKAQSTFYSKSINHVMGALSSDIHDL